MAHVHLSPNLTSRTRQNGPVPALRPFSIGRTTSFPGAVTHAKGDDQYPEKAPAFIARGQGCHVWDVDGNEFIEYGMGVRAVTLGHAYKPVVEAAYRQMQLGANFTRPASAELEAAERVLEVIDGADMVPAGVGLANFTEAVVTSEPL